MARDRRLDAQGRPRDGVFRHRALWRYSWCPACGGERCDGCSWKGIVATPAE